MSKLLFSERKAISEKVDGWYDEHPEAQRCSLNTITALQQLGLLGGTAEIDQLRARVAELEKLCFVAHGELTEAYNHGFIASTCRLRLDELLNRTRAQSLAAHDAALLRGLAKVADVGLGDEHGTPKWFSLNGDYLRREADRVEREAGV